MLSFGIISSVIVLFPLTNALILLLFQHFYCYEETLWLLPLYAIPAYGVTEMYSSITTPRKKALLVPIMCIVFFLCGWMAFDNNSAELQTNISDAVNIDEEYIQVYDFILDYEKTQLSGKRIVMAAPRKLMECARLYSGDIGLAYGRDIWETNLDYAFYEPNEEAAYDLAQKMEEEIDKYTYTFVKDLHELNVNYLVLNKDNLVYDEDMQYPSEFKNKDAKYHRVYETRHFVIYVTK